MIDKIESISIGFADAIYFNSKFTEGTVLNTFKGLKNARKVQKGVLYPCVHNEPLVELQEGEPKPQKYLLSLNRFETRKNIKRAMIAYIKGIEFFRSQGVGLKIAGGLKKENPDSMKCITELKSLVEEAGVGDMVTFHTNVGHAEKEQILR